MRTPARGERKNERNGKTEKSDAVETRCAICTFAASPDHGRKGKLGVMTGRRSIVGLLQFAFNLLIRIHALIGALKKPVGCCNFRSINKTYPST